MSRPRPVAAVASFVERPPLQRFTFRTQGNKAATRSHEEPQQNHQAERRSSRLRVGYGAFAHTGELGKLALRKVSLVPRRAQEHGQ